LVIFGVLDLYRIEVMLFVSVFLGNSLLLFEKIKKIIKIITIKNIVFICYEFIKKLEFKNNEKIASNKKLLIIVSQVID
jgi:hypothetical protein